MGACGSSGKKGKEDPDDGQEHKPSPKKEDVKPGGTPEPTPPKTPEKNPPPKEDTEENGSDAPEAPKDPFDEIDDSEILSGVKENYEFVKEIGKGGYSVVYSAVAKRDAPVPGSTTMITRGQHYAIKWIKKETLADSDDVKLLKREICIMKRVNHPNILKLYEVYEEEDDFYLVLELIDGKELFDKIVERGQYSEQDAAPLVRQVVSAVDYLHGIGIAHRDLKPENLLTYGDPESIKLADFGFSKNFGEEKMATSVGSPGYVAPEVLTQESYTMAVDMWSIGVIIYILLCGYPPFYAETTPELFKKIMQVQYDFEDTNWEYVSDAAKDLIRHLLVKDPKKRYTAQECLNDPWIKEYGSPQT